MNRKKKKKRDMSISAAVKLGAISFALFFAGIYVKNQTQIQMVASSLEGQMLEMGQGIIRAYQVRIENARENNLDLELNEYMSNITDFPRVLSSMVIDMNGTVIAHNNVTEWGRVYRDRETLEILKERNFTYYNRVVNRRPAYELVQPLTGMQGQYIGVHRIVISAETIAQRVAHLRSQSMKQVFLWAFVFAVVTGVLSKFLLLYGGPPIKYILNTIMAERWTAKEKRQAKVLYKKDEWGDLARHCDYVARRINDEKQLYKSKMEKAQSDLQSFIEQICKGFKSGSVLTDAENKVLYINDAAINILGFDPSVQIKGAHITSVLKHPQMMELFQKSIRNANQMIVNNISSPPVQVSAVGIYSVDQSLLGVLMLIEGNPALRSGEIT